VHLFQLQLSDKWIELFELQRVVLDALLVAVFLQVFRCGGPERAQLARTIESGLAKLDYAPREILFGLPDVACSSAFANACSSELFIDVPDPTPFGETRRSLTVTLLRRQRAEVGPEAVLQLKTLPTKKGRTNPSLTGPKTLLNETI
jgi:hypothetical protein